MKTELKGHVDKKEEIKKMEIYFTHQLLLLLWLEGELYVCSERELEEQRDEKQSIRTGHLVEFL